MITCNELFSGIGSQRLALERINIPHKIIGISEIDKFAIKSYEAIYEPTYNYGDISKIDKLNYADFWTYSFPCQNISLSGKQEGLGKGTRSGLLYEVQRLLNISKEHNELPKYLMLENVKNLVGKKFKKDFEKWLENLNDLGYNNYWQILNSKDCGIPQNRERVFVISIRQDVDKGNFKFPEPINLTYQLQDILESNVEEKYYISQELEEKFKLQILNKTISNTIRCGGRGSLDRHSWDIIAEHINFPLIGASRGRYNDEGKTEQQFELNQSGCTNTLTTVQKDNLLVESCSYRIRKLTPKECWRLMGFSDAEFDKASKVCSNTQLFKQAENSIVVNVLEAIFKNLFE